MNFGAIDPSKLPRAEALQQSPARPAANPGANSDAVRLPRLKNGPAADVFVKSTKPGDTVQQQSSVERAGKLESTHFSGGKIVPPIPHEAAPATRPSLAEKLFGNRPRVGINQSAESKLNMAKKPAQSGLGSMLLSLGSLGALTSCVAGPALLVAKPGLVSQVAASLPTRLP